MERQEIETFLTLSEELHFGRTAQRLRITPARVTQIIQKLERQIGAPLFARTSRTVRLTDLGRQLNTDLTPHHLGILAAIQRATAAGRGVRGVLRLGFLGPASADRLSALIEQFAQAYPAASARIVLEVEVGNHLQPLRNDRVDVVATHLPVREPDITVGPVILRERQMVAVPANHPLAGQDAASLEDLIGETVVTLGESAPRYWVEHFMPPHTPSGRPITYSLQVDTIQAGLALCGAGKCVALVVEQMARFYPRRDVVYLPLIDAPLGEIAMVWSTTTQKTELVHALAETAVNAGVVGPEVG
ncbi:LysR family transcriptional regulator [Micromonospora zhanjiangensis]|uniref:LysR family transcriptional regulator n=1 Tax=Micromonospora zhanjiangensis TaxID=1522057 RepID=A0ABV8KQG9_9ACTN